jgi:type III pantothenate kinase
MNLIVDYGNSLAKVGVFKGYQLTQQYAFDDREKLRSFVQNFSADNFILSSVADQQIPIMSWASHIQRKYILSAALPIPVNNLYATPHTLGVDRIAGICGAWQRFPNTNCLVIDAGTCVTYDILDKDGNYHGGGISPGLRMRLQAMHTFTARLPLANVIDSPPLIGNTTEACLQSGAINGMIAEINGIIDRYAKEFEGLQVILCGGDGRFFENKLKESIFALPELVLSGLNSILIYNVGD